jgi:hypothetical protein
MSEDLKQLLKNLKAQVVYLENIIAECECNDKKREKKLDMLHARMLTMQPSEDMPDNLRYEAREASDGRTYYVDHFQKTSSWSDPVTENFASNS